VVVYFLIWECMHLCPGLGISLVFPSNWNNTRSDNPGTVFCGVLGSENIICSSSIKCWLLGCRSVNMTFVV
jgi:hypothetical protein